MKRIALVFTGGTIGGRAQNGRVALDDGAQQRLVAYCKKQCGDTVCFDAVQPFCMLSENSTPQHWEALTSALAAMPLAAYDGVVVTHGSDTLAYTSALLGFLFGGSEVPIVLTAANHPFGEENSNAAVNLLSSIRLILSEKVRGVLTVYRDEDGRVPVYLPTRLLEADSACDRFSSFGGVPFGWMDEHGLSLCASPYNPSLSRLGQCAAPPYATVHFEKPVLAIRPYPGLRYDDIAIERYAAVLHGLYHSATACTEEGVYSLPRFLARCRASGKPVYAASVKAGQAAYDGSEKLWQAGAVPLCTQSFTAAYVKLCIACNQTAEPIEQYMKKTIAFETIS